MASRGLRSVCVASLAIAGTVALGAAPAITPAVTTGLKTVLAETVLLDTESWIMGGSGLPIPPPAYLQAVTDRFITPTPPFFTGQPVFPVDASNPLFTPEGLYPLTGVKSLPLDTSLAQGVSILNSTIQNEITDGNNLVVLGYSQSATINSLVMKDLLALPPGEQPTAEQLSWVLLGDPSNANGGLLERFNFPDLSPGMPQLTIPSLGVTFSGATPSDTPWDTAIYTQEYDGFADFPRYPINLLSDINAFLGILFVHGKYPSLTDEQMASAMLLPVSEGYAGHTDYFMIPTQTLPLLQPLLSIPVIGQPLYSLLEPDLRILVNLGYGNIEHGWDPGPADLPTPMGLFPDLDWSEVFTALIQGAEKGFNDFVGDLQDLSFPTVDEWLGNVAQFTMPSFVDIVNTLTSVAATAYATLLPTADIINALLTTLPTYAASLFINELSEGNLLEAFGLPIAATTGLTTMALGFEFDVISGALSSISAELGDLFS